MLRWSNETREVLLVQASSSTKQVTIKTATCTMIHMHKMESYQQIYKIPKIKYLQFKNINIDSSIPLNHWHGERRKDPILFRILFENKFLKHRVSSRRQFLMFSRGLTFYYKNNIYKPTNNFPPLHKNNTAKSLSSMTFLTFRKINYRNGNFFMWVVFVAIFK